MNYVTDILMPEPMPSDMPPNNSKYPFGTMPVGASFAVPIEDGGKARGAAASWKTRHPGWNYTTRKTTDGVRLWRIA
jgi:hypothetical protein